MAIGSGSEGAQTALKESYRSDLSFDEAEVLALSTLKQVMEEKVGCQGAETRTSRVACSTPPSCRAYLCARQQNAATRVIVVQLPVNFIFLSFAKAHPRPAGAILSSDVEQHAHSHILP